MEEMLRIKIQEIKVIFLACREKLVKAVFDIASELGMTSEHFLWVGTESVVQGINNTAEDTPIVNFIGIKTSTSDETIGKQHSLAKVLGNFTSVFASFFCHHVMVKDVRPQSRMFLLADGG